MPLLRQLPTTVGESAFGDPERSTMAALALRPEPRLKARNLPTRYGARDVGAQANRIRLAGPALSLDLPRPEVSMSIVVRFNPTNVTTEKYEESIRRLEAAGAWPPDGLEYHVMFGSEGNLKVSEIWDSQEKLEEFGERMMPILADIGIEFSGAPDVFEAHNIIKR